MKVIPLIVLATASFTLGVLVQSTVAEAQKAQLPTITFDGSAAPAAMAAPLLDGALMLAEGGSWERIAVGRAWYLGGDKKRGQEILDGVTGSKKVESSDWFRVARVYEEAGEWDKAQTAFDRALEMKKNDDSGMVEYGAYANLHKDRAKAEKLFDAAFKKNSREFWHWVGAGGSYLGVRPQP